MCMCHSGDVSYIKNYYITLTNYGIFLTRVIVETVDLVVPSALPDLVEKAVVLVPPENLDEQERLARMVYPAKGALP